MYIKRYNMTTYANDQVNVSDIENKIWPSTRVVYNRTSLRTSVAMAHFVEEIDEQLKWLSSVFLLNKAA